MIAGQTGQIAVSFKEEIVALWVLQSESRKGILTKLGNRNKWSLYKENLGWENGVIGQLRK